MMPRLEGNTGEFLSKVDVKARSGSIWLRIRPVTGRCEYGEKTTGFQQKQELFY